MLQGPCLNPACLGLQASSILNTISGPSLAWTFLHIYAHFCKASHAAVMCGSIARFDVEGMIYLNWQTRPSDHQLSEEAVAKGPGGRVGTVSVERNSRRPPPPPKFTQAHQKEVQRASYDSDSLCLANDNQYLKRNYFQAPCSTPAFQLDGTPPWL